MNPEKIVPNQEVPSKTQEELAAEQIAQETDPLKAEEMNLAAMEAAAQAADNELAKQIAQSVVDLGEGEDDFDTVFDRLFGDPDATTVQDSEPQQT